MSQIEAIVDQDDLDLEELLNVEGIDEKLCAAIESVHIVYQGVLTTPVERYSEPGVKDALKRRLSTISEGTGVSLEGLMDNLESLDKVTVSQEADFVGAVAAIVRQIMEWLGNVKRFFIELWRKVFNRKNTVIAASKANTVKYESTVKQYQASKKELPKTVKCVVPGRCYILFHAKPHLPKAGFVYNQEGLEKALTNVPKDVDRIIEAMASETETTLNAVSALLGQIGKPNTAVVGIGSPSYRTIDEPLKSLKNNRKMYGLYHDKFEVIGMGVIAKPLRNAARYHNEKFALTDTSRDHGWNAVDSFEITLDVEKIKDLNKDIAKNANDKLTAIALLVDRVVKSREIDELSKKLKDQRMVTNMISVGQDPDGVSVTLNDAQGNLARLELMTEYVNQLSDNLSLLYSFYGRYIETLSVISQRAVTELQNHSS